MSGSQHIYYVYGLHYPDGRLFYVGKGKGGRIYDHVTDAHAKRCRNKHLQGTIRKIEKAGGRVGYKKFFTALNEADALNKERELIAFHGKRTDNSGILVNLSDGGEGSSGYRHTDEAKKKVSAAHKGNTYRRGKKMTPEQCQRVSDGHKGLASARKGKTHTEEAKAKMRAARAKQISPMKGKRHSEETKAKISATKQGTPAWNKGLPQKPGLIELMNKNWRGSKHPPEVIEKIRAASKAMWAARSENFSFGKPSQESIEKMRISAKAAWSRRKAEAACHTM
jgi:hypothetical protein